MESLNKQQNQHHCGEIPLIKPNKKASIEIGMSIIVTKRFSNLSTTPNSQSEIRMCDKSLLEAIEGANSFLDRKRIEITAPSEHLKKKMCRLSLNPKPKFLKKQKSKSIQPSPDRTEIRIKKISLFDNQESIYKSTGF